MTTTPKAGRRSVLYFKKGKNMWDRRSLKTNAKSLLKINYWKVVVASLILMLCAGTLPLTGLKNSSDKIDEGSFSAELEAMDPGALLAVLLVALSVIAVASLIAFLISVFVCYPLEIGAQKLLINCRDDRAEYGDIVYSFKHSYLNAVKTLFLRGLFILLWSLLFLIPGIVKSYEYKMIPYLLAENPQMNSKEAFARSREMMRGNKWGAFVLDLSFIGWHLLGGLTFGIVEIFYAAPYNYLTDAELYHALKNR